MILAVAKACGLFLFTLLTRAFLEWIWMPSSSAHTWNSSGCQDMTDPSQASRINGRGTFRCQLHVSHPLIKMSFEANLWIWNQLLKQRLGKQSQHMVHLAAVVFVCRTIWKDLLLRLFLTSQPTTFKSNFSFHQSVAWRGIKWLWALVVKHQFRDFWGQTSTQVAHFHHVNTFANHSPYANCNNPSPCPRSTCLGCRFGMLYAPFQSQSGYLPYFLNMWALTVLWIWHQISLSPAIP